MTVESIELTRTKFQENGVQPEALQSTWKFWQKKRYIVVFMTFLGLCNIYTLRVNLSVAIVAMTDHRTVTYPNGTIGYVQDFPWDSKQKGIILSSFFYGYILTQFLGGWLSSRIPGNLVFGIGIFVTSILTLLTPIAANGGFSVMITVRVIEGIFEGVTFPCLQVIWSKWAPPHERSRFGTFTYMGVYVGTVVSMLLSGIFADNFGWESVFYVFGVLGCIWFIAWIIIVKESPEEDSKISRDELEYIQNCQGNIKYEKVIHPWKAIFTSVPMYAICIANFTENWGLYTLNTQMPTFLKDTLNYDITEAGILSSAPYLTIAILLPFTGYLADMCQIKEILTTSQVRKYFTCGSFIAQTLFLIVAAYLLDPVGSVACIVVGVGLGSFSWSGFGVNYLDIAPQHASVMHGISNTIATISGIVSPTLTGYIVQNKLPSEWQIVFYIAAVIYFIGSLLYWFGSSGELQPWAVNSKSTTQNSRRENKNVSGYVNQAAEVTEIK